jgi:hypothetical protein
MRKFLKVLLLSFLILVILAVGAVYVLFTHYKKEMHAEVISTLKTSYGIDLKTGELKVSLFATWPQVAVQLHDVEATSEKFPGSEFRAGTLALSFNIRELLNRRFVVQSLSVKDADILFVKHVDTTSSKKPFRQEEPESQPVEFEIGKIVLRNTHFRFTSPSQGQNVDLDLVHNTIRLKNFTDGNQAHMTGRIFVRTIAFRAKRGTFFDSTRAKLNLHVTYFSNDGSLCFMPGSVLMANEHKYNIAANLYLKDNKRIMLSASTEKVTLNQVRKLVNNKIRRVLRNYDARGPINARVLLVAGIGRREDPAMIIYANTEHNKIWIGTGKVPYRNIAFNGKIVCLDAAGKKGDMTRAHVTFDRVSGNIYDFPFTATVKVNNLQRPYVSIRGKMNIDASKVDFNLKNEFELRGNAQAFIRYSGLAEHINHEEFLGKGMKLRAELKMINLSYREKKRPYVYTLNGLARVNNTDLYFDDLHLSTLVAEATLKGHATNFVNYVLGYSNGFRTTLNAYTDSLNLNPVMIKPKSQAPLTATEPVKQKNSAEPSTRARHGAQAPDTADLAKLNALLEKNENFSSFEFDVNLFAKKMLMRRVYAEDAAISLNYKNEILDIRSLKLHTCEGRISGSAVISDFNRVKADISVEDVNVNMMFTQFENFGQEAILSENIQGKIYLDASFTSHLDDNLEVIGETMSGEVRLSLRDGQLVNFEPLQKLSTFLFKNRDFNNITFSELNESFQVRGYEMKIDEFEIGSNILNLFVVNGVYNFKGQSNINLLVPWSNLKRRGRNYVPRTSGETAENSKGVKLNFSGPSNKMKLSLGHKDLASLRTSF